jgi:hypothetical protein
VYENTKIDPTVTQNPLPPPPPTPFLSAGTHTELDIDNFGFCLWRRSLSRAEFLDEIQTKVIRVFLFAIHSHLYSFALPFLQAHTPLTVFTVQLLYTVKEKGGKPDRKPYPLLYG